VRITGRFPGKDTSNALHLPSAFLGIHNSRSCLFVLFVPSFVVYLTTLSVARYIYSVLLTVLVSNELEGMRKESSVAEYKTAP
jgi:hypothetical protein